MAEKQELLERRGLRKMGGENSPISPPLDPRLLIITIQMKEINKNLLFMEAMSKIYLKLRYYFKLWRLSLDLKSVSTPDVVFFCHCCLANY